MNPHKQRQDRIETLHRLADANTERAGHIRAAAARLEDASIDPGQKAEWVSIARTLYEQADALDADARDRRERATEVASHMKAGHS